MRASPLDPVPGMPSWIRTVPRAPDPARVAAHERERPAWEGIPTPAGSGPASVHVARRFVGVLRASEGEDDDLQALRGAEDTIAMGAWLLAHPDEHVAIRVLTDEMAAHLYPEAVAPGHRPGDLARRAPRLDPESTEAGEAWAVAADRAWPTHTGARWRAAFETRVRADAGRDPAVLLDPLRLRLLRQLQWHGQYAGWGEAATPSLFGAEGGWSGVIRGPEACARVRGLGEADAVLALLTLQLHELTDQALRTMHPELGRDPEFLQALWRSPAWTTRALGAVLAHPAVAVPGAGAASAGASAWSAAEAQLLTIAREGLGRTAAAAFDVWWQRHVAVGQEARARLVLTAATPLPRGGGRRSRMDPTEDELAVDDYDRPTRPSGGIVELMAHPAVYADPALVAHALDHVLSDATNRTPFSRLRHLLPSLPPRALRELVRELVARLPGAGDAGGWHRDQVAPFLETVLGTATPAQAEALGGLGAAWWAALLHTPSRSLRVAALAARALGGPGVPEDHQPGAPDSGDLGLGDGADGAASSEDSSSSPRLRRLRPR